MMKKLTLLLSVFCISFSVWAQKGAVKGQVTDKNTGEEIIGANIMVEGQGIGAATDIFGNFQFTIAPGTYTVVCSFVGYQQFKVTELTIAADEVVTLNMQLSEDSQLMDGVTVEAQADRGSSEMLMVDRKAASLMVQNIGAMELAKIGASDAGAGLKRVVGLSVQGSKFVVVRGLADRYNGSYLNGFTVASPNPDKRVLPYDIFPTDIIQNLDVVKNFSPSYYGDFTGASVNLLTKSFTDEQQIDISFGIGMNTQTTFKDFLSDPARSNDVLGFNKDRNTTSTLDAKYLSPFTGQPLDFNSRNLEGQQQIYNTSWDPESISAPLNHNASISYTNFFDVNDDLGIGLLLNANYGASSVIQEGGFVRLENTGNAQVDFKSDIYDFNTNFSGLANIALKYKENHDLRLYNLYTHLSENNVREDRGFFFDSFEDKRYVRRITYKDYILLANQFDYTGKFDKLTVNLGGSLSNATSSEPDRRQIILDYAPEWEDSESYLFTKNDARNNQRVFIEFEDQEFSGRAKINYALKRGDNDLGETADKMSVEVGVDYKNRDRTQSIRRFNHSIQDNNAFRNLFPEERVGIYEIDNLISDVNVYNDVLRVQEDPVQGDGYDASIEVIAPFVNFKTELISDVLDMNIGLRYEDANQEVSYYLSNPNTPDVTRIESSDIFPAISFRYSASKKDIFRLAGSRTVSRPDFKEIAPFRYVPNFGNYLQVGNPGIENGYNLNFDFRYERYTRRNGLLALGLFAKLLDAPIVTVGVPSGTPTITYTNADQASLIGAEIEIRQNLGLISEALDNFFFNTNLSLLSSNVKFADVTRLEFQNLDLTGLRDRDLVGASRYLFNADISYEKFATKVDYNFSVAYNIFGRRIYGIGVNGLGDIFELPYGTLNFTASSKFGTKRQWGAKFTARNILNPAIRQEQEILDLNTFEVLREQEIITYKKGINFSLSLTYSIF